MSLKKKKAKEKKTNRSESIKKQGKKTSASPKSKAKTTKRAKPKSSLSSKAKKNVISKKKTATARKTTAKPAKVTRKRVKVSSAKLKKAKAVKKTAKRKSIKKKPITREVFKELRNFPGSYEVADRPEYQHQAQALPRAYNDNKIVAMVRDPWWLYVYWEITDGKLNEAKQVLGDKMHEARFVLRVYDVTDINIDSQNANNFCDIDIMLDAASWYIEVGRPNKAFCVDLGILTQKGEFKTLLRSNVAMTPRWGPSDVVDENWMIMSEDFEKLYAVSIGSKVGSSPTGLKKVPQKALNMRMGSGFKNRKK